MDSFSFLVNNIALSTGLSALLQVRDGHNKDPKAFGNSEALSESSKKNLAESNF